jgi:hypothetical protein
MAAMTAYLDASGSPDSTRVVAVAGLVATPEQWKQFQVEWQECLGAHGVSALHMKDFAQCREEFSSWAEDEPKRRRFLNKLLWIIEDAVLYTFTDAVHMSDYRKLDLKYALSQFMRPYSLASLTCASGIIMWAEANGHSREDITYVFEHGDTDQADLRRCWNTSNPTLRSALLVKKKIDAYPDPEIVGPIRPFEAADLIAYEIHKAHISLQDGGGHLFFDQLRRPMQRMAGLPGAQQWRIADLNTLDKICSRAKIPLHPGI